MELNISVPASWEELDQEQLAFLLNTMANVGAIARSGLYASREDYSARTRAETALYCLLRWSGLKLVCPYADGYLMRLGPTEFRVDAEVLAAALAALDWIASVPSRPVRLERVGKARAVPADLTDFPFDSYLYCDVLWQLYMDSEDPEMLRRMAERLYDRDGIELSDGELLGVFYWWASVKAFFASMFPNFLRSAEGGGADGSGGIDALRAGVDAQIRALTKGDVTKEAEIRALDAWRALTELDTQAREYAELKKLTSKSS